MSQKRLIEQTACDHGYFEDCPALDHTFNSCPGGSSREVTAVGWLLEQGATTEVVGEPGYHDHHGNDGAFVAPGRYLVYNLDVGGGW